MSGLYNPCIKVTGFPTAIKHSALLEYILLILNYGNVQYMIHPCTDKSIFILEQGKLKKTTVSTIFPTVRNS